MHALIRPRAKSIDAAPVGYFCSNGAALAPRRHCELCLHLSTEQIERFEKVAIYLVRAAHSVPSDACCLGPHALQDVRVRPFQQLRSWTKGCPPGPMTAPSRYKDWSPAAIFGGNSNDARVHPRGHLGGQSSAPRSPGAQAAALASAWRGRGGDRGDGLLSALAEMNGIISDGVAEEEDRVAPADWRTRAKQHEKPRKAKPRRRPPAPVRSPDMEARQRQRQEQRMRAVHTIQRGWRARRVVDRTARQRPEAIRRRQWGAVELDAALQIQDAWRDRKRWLAGADEREAKRGARIIKILFREARVRAAVILECAWRRKMAYELAGEAMWQLRQRKHRAAAVVQDALRRKLAHNALRRKLCWRRAAATLLAAHERGRSSRRAFGVARGASTRLAAMSRRKVAMEQFRVAVAAAVTLQRRARGRSGRRIGIYRAALRESVAVSIRRMEAVAEAMSAASDAAEAARLRAIAYAIAMEIHPICNPSVVAQHAAAFDGSDADKQSWMRHFIDKGLRAVEQLADHPATGAFLHGDAPGLADCVLVPQIYNARRWGVALDAMPRLVAIDDACQALPAFATAAPEAVNSAAS